ncbi:MAG: hypothetical protein KatS3mg103_0505 [Phycisphaerales bacterium]|nr:MAG: hypothetical protein KatS3mg103_0505 [Phycisphaerales bacterium]
MVSGPVGDVEAFEALARAYDREQSFTRDVQTLAVARGDVQSVVDRALELYELSGLAEREPIEVDVDVQRRLVTAVGRARGARTVRRVDASERVAGAGAA